MRPFRSSSSKRRGIVDSSNVGNRAWVVAITCVGIALLGSRPVRGQGLPGPPPDPCFTDPTSALCIGRWLGPYELCSMGPIGCNYYSESCGSPICSTCVDSSNNPVSDEIAHAALIPTGPWAGDVLIWTRCDNPGQNPNFKSYIWDPVNNTIDASASFAGADEPFCCGHAWVLDGSGNTKLLCVGGGNGTVGSDKAFWFDPGTVQWSEAPNDLGAGNWYPTVISFGDDAVSDSAIAVIGGSLQTGSAQICGTNLFNKWWTLPSPFTPPAVWTEHSNALTGLPPPNDKYRWFQYPRTILLSQNYIISSGHDVTCEDDKTNPFPGFPDSTTDWGGNPVQLIEVTTRTHLANQISVDPNPPPDGSLVLSAGHQPIRGWNSSNTVVLHTLKSDWTWTSDPALALGKYNLDRLLAFGGSPKLRPGTYDYNAHQAVLELTGASSSAPNAWAWKEKNRPAAGRSTGNWVLLPDGTILAVGGGPKRHTVHSGTTERFDPEGPPGLIPNGVWKTMDARPQVAGFYTPRRYHSVALLLQNGEVALMGGNPLGNPGALPDPSYTAEIFKPPYRFYSGRPGLTNVPTTIYYPKSSMDPNTFCVETTVAASVKHACLIGVGAVTHHFDYGQRYVELMVRPASCSGGNLEILPPPKASLAPPGHYLLFLVNQQRVPSVGRLVKLDYEP